MPPKRSKASKNQEKKKGGENDWRLHDLYSTGASFNRIVTRSQTAFNRIKNSESDLDLFTDPDRHQLDDQPHLMEVMKGKYGAIPRTIITRSTAKHLSESEELCKMLDVYKSQRPSGPEDAAAIELELPVLATEPSAPEDDAAAIEEPVLSTEPSAPEDASAIEEPVLANEPSAPEDAAVIEEPVLDTEPSALEDSRAIEEPVLATEPSVPESSSSLLQTIKNLMKR